MKYGTTGTTKRLRILIIIFTIIKYSLHELCVHCYQCNHYNDAGCNETEWSVHRLPNGSTIIILHINGMVNMSATCHEKLYFQATKDFHFLTYKVQ